MFNPDLSGFTPYFTQQPGTSGASTNPAAAMQNTLANFPTFGAAETLMQNVIRNPHPYRNEIPRGNKRERTKFDPQQLELMERFFSTKKYPDGNEREEMAKALNLTDVKVQIWFKNRRAKDRNQRHLDELMAKSRGDLNPIKRCVTPVVQSHKKKRKTESPLPDPLQHLQPPPPPLPQHHSTKDGIKHETVEGSAAYDYGNSMLESWDKGIRANYPITNYNGFQFAPSAADFYATNQSLMNQYYPPYPVFNPSFNPSAYYSNAAACYDIYNQQTLPNFKDTKTELASTTESPNISPTEIEQHYTKFT